MRKFLFLFLVTFVISCSSNDEETTNNGNTTPTNLKKPKKISVYQGNFQGTGNPMEVYNFQYDGNKLIKITADNYQVIIEYGNLYGNDNTLFSKITETYSNGYTIYTPEYFTTNSYTNRFGRLNYKTYLNNQLTGTYQRNYSFDTQNRVISCAVANIPNSSVGYTYEYDSNNRVIKETQNNGSVKNITYDNKNNVFKNVITPFYKNVQGERNNLWLGKIENNYLTYGNINYSYNYDNEGYPIKIVWNNDYLTEIIEY